MHAKLNYSSSILWDLDGTLFYMSEQAKQEYLRTDWDAFMRIQVKAPPIEPMATLARVLALDHNNIMMTSRTEASRRDTRLQLKKAEIPCEHLFMRPLGNHDPSPALKLRMYEQFTADFEGQHISLLIDDREDVVNAFTAKGIPALLYKGQ